MGLGRVTSFSITRSNLHLTNHKLVNSLSRAPLVLRRATGNFGLTRFTTAQTRGKPPPSPIQYSLHYSATLTSKWHFSRNSQGGIPKLSQFGLPGLWQFITPCSDLRLGWGLKQTCSSPWQLSNGVFHSTCTHRGRVDSRLLVVGSQIASLTPGPSFIHNLCCKCPNDSCEATFDIYASRSFQRYKEHLKERFFDPCNRALSFWESRRTPTSPFRECECHPHIPSKWGCDKTSLCHLIPWRQIGAIGTRSIILTFDVLICLYVIGHHLNTSSMTIFSKTKIVTTLALGLRPRQGGYKVAGQEGDQGVTSHAPESAKSVREWTLRLPRELPC
jgi:hypothetical protein